MRARSARPARSASRIRRCSERVRSTAESSVRPRHTRAREVELITGVADTLTALAGRHHLLLLTKGDQEEQQAKVTASSIDHHFRGIHIVAEKSVDTYRQLTTELGLDPDRTWMIGNSPKSDIAPARRAGLRTVFIPHEHTWVLEHVNLGPDEATLQLTAFPELLRHF